jgi:hypothetical protein
MKHLRHPLRHVPPYVWGWLGVLAMMAAIIVFFNTVE